MIPGLSEYVEAKHATLDAQRLSTRSLGALVVGAGCWVVVMAFGITGQSMPTTSSVADFLFRTGMLVGMLALGACAAYAHAAYTVGRREIENGGDA